MIFFNDALRIQVSVSDVTFQTIPFAIFGNLLLTDADFYVLTDFKKLVVSTSIDLLFSYAPALISLFQTCYTAVSVIGILFCAFLRIANYETFAIRMPVFITRLVLCIQ